MSAANRSGLLLDLAALDPPVFWSEVFAHWCCQASVTLLARDMLTLDVRQSLAPGTFLRFTCSLPGVEDLPQLDVDSLQSPSMATGHRNLFLIIPDGVDVDVLVIIYEMVSNL